MAKPKIAIVGANFAGMSAASKLPSSVDVTVIEPRDVFEWVPNIHEVLSGVKTPEDVTLPMTEMIEKLSHRRVKDRVQHLDLDSNRLELESGGYVDYDAVILACGQSQSHWGIDTLSNFAYPFRTASDVEAIRNHLENRLGRELDTQVTVVGAGFTGIEVVGELLRKHRDNPKITINVVDAAHRIASALPSVVSNNISKLCESLPINFFLGEHVEDIQQDAVILKSGQRVESDIIIWAAGTQTPPLIAESAASAGNQSGIAVNDCLQSYSHANVFAAGDVCASPWKLAKQASYAMDTGAFAAKNVQRWLDGKHLKTFKPSLTPIALAFGDLNTYLIQGDNVAASPLLASGKELIYQGYMTKFSFAKSLLNCSGGTLQRGVNALNNLFLPQLLAFDLAGIAKRSRILQVGRVNVNDTAI